MNQIETTSRRSIAYWIATAIAALLFVVPGVGLIARLPHFTNDMASLNYPAYFLSLLGAWKVLGAIAILVPGVARLKEWAYAGMMFDLSGAVVSRVASGDVAFKTLVPLAVAAVVCTSWALRPEGRVLQP